jgi:hypothetical protein
VREEGTTDLLEAMITVTATATEVMKDTGLQGMSESHCGCPKMTASDGKLPQIATGGEIGIVHDLLHGGGTDHISIFDQFRLYSICRSAC